VESLLLNWSLPQYDLDPAWIREQIDRITQQMAAQGKTYCTTYERMCSEGIDPIDGIEALLDLLQTYIKAGQKIVGHNAWAFDRVRVDHHTSQFFDEVIDWGTDSLIDTGMIEKAAQMNRPPYAGEPLSEWYSRVRGGFSHIKWNLENHCVEKYRLVERFGVDPHLAHDAGHDCRMTHALFETYRQITEAFLG
jgi:hypothetical protein